MHSSIFTRFARKPGVGAPLMERLGRFLLPAIGWRVEGLELLTGSQYVLVVAPHTSNWDLPVGLICAHALGLFTNWQVGYLIKAEAIRWPLIGRLLHWFGGIPVERHAAQDVVDQVVAIFRTAGRLVIAITPEGTRSHRDYWKTGFYRIALKAEVPLALAFLDFKRRVAGIGKVFTPSGDPETDIQIIREFYAPITARHPGKVGAIRFRPGDLA